MTEEEIREGFEKRWKHVFEGFPRRTVTFDNALRIYETGIMDASSHYEQENKRLREALEEVGNQLYEDCDGIGDLKLCQQIIGSALSKEEGQ